MHLGYHHCLPSLLCMHLIAMLVFIHHRQSIDITTETKVFKLDNAQAEALSTKLQEMLSPKVGKAKFDAASNKLFVTDTAAKLKEIDKFVQQLPPSHNFIIIRMLIANR